MATLFAQIGVKSGMEAQFEALCRTLYEHSHAQETGLRRYEYWRAADPGRYYCLLAFDDYRQFMVHQTSDYHEAAVPGLGEAIETMRLEWVDPVPGASDLPATVAQPLPDDASPLARRYATSIPFAIASWWAAVAATAAD